MALLRLEPQNLKYHVEFDHDGTVTGVVLGPEFPPCILVSQTSFRRAFITESRLHSLGYRPSRWRPECRATEYVRPWPRWAAVKCWDWTVRQWWKPWAWAFRHHLIHEASQGLQFRWRDLRLGPPRA